MSIPTPSDPRLSRLAKLDIQDAKRWYRRKYSAAAARHFLLAVNECVARIAERPEAHTLVFRHYRKALVSGFPYSVYYTADRGKIEVIAVMHWRRHERDWKSRVT